MQFVALAWRPADPDGAGLAAELSARLDRDGRWASAGRTRSAGLWVEAGRRARVHTLPRGRGFLLGEVFGPEGRPAPKAWIEAVLAGDPPGACRQLAGGAWGPYLVLFLDSGGRRRLFRDPSGAIDALSWRRGPVAVVASEVHDLPPGLLPDRVALDWSALARILRAPGRAALELPLDGMSLVRPGVLEDLDGGAGLEVWSPRRFVERPGPEPGEARRELVARVDAAVGALVRGHDRILAELSGGFDSAVVGSALAAQGLAGRAAAWINYFDRRPAGDERAYARAAAARLGVRLTEAPLAAEPLEAADFAGLARSARPPVTGVGRFQDLDLARRARAAGASAILGGQGGDAAFFQMPTPLLLSDALRLEGAAALRRGVLGDLARWTRSSAWTVLRRGLRSAAEPPLPAAVPGLRAEATASPHPWVAEAADAPAAKRLQIAALGQAWLYAGDNEQRRAADLLNPLFAQPVMELVLSIPAPVLTEGGRDRALARAAFADRLPPAILDRRSKGGLGGYYGEVAQASLDWLRSHLLDGCLCDAGLLDREALAAALTPEHLAWRGQAVPLLEAALVESWVRWWQARVPDSPRAPRSAMAPDPWTLARVRVR